MSNNVERFNIVEIEQSVELDSKSLNKSNNVNITCYDGPPSVSGMPGIHHILSRTLKDIFCRYNILKGNNVTNRAGWDTHGLPVELNVEKALVITKKDIGTTISVADYNHACHDSIIKFIDQWREITTKHGYCTDIDDPYITCDKRYMESEWWAFKTLFDNGYIYSDYSIQPYSPAAGTGLSSHELNQPGCYRIVKDQTVVAMFKSCDEDNTFYIAWTTTPWTLPANSALAVNSNVTYVKISCKNIYSQEVINVILAKECLGHYFTDDSQYTIVQTYKGSELIGRTYEQLYTFVKCKGKAFEVINGDYVTTDDGTGIVHIALSFGADDRRVAKEAGICDITVTRDGKEYPIVDEQGRYVSEITPWSGRYVKQAYESDDEQHDLSVDIEIVKNLKQRKLCFKTEKHEHSYPHCWRTDKPLLYYPLKAWFIKTTAVKDKLIELNKHINWHPSSTGTGRFNNWLENIVDWNVSRNRFWGVPIPLWITDDEREIKCIGSFSELSYEIEKANNILNLNQTTVLDDVHKPYIDDVILASDTGKKMHRVTDVLDVWFDSGCMPFAQWHYPFENKEQFEEHYPADFICEGVDQTRGWFYTLHVISTMIFGNIAYKNVVSNGLVLDKNGNKMSKRLGNTIDPFELIDKYGADPVRWYMVYNTNPWENIKFDVAGVEEVIKKFFMTMFNTYNFFAMYYNASFKDLQNINVPVKTLCGIDRWVLSRLNNMLATVNDRLSSYDPTPAIRAINDFVIDDMSNWYVRLNRKRFSKNNNTDDKTIAFNILYECLYKTALLLYPFAPHFGKWLSDSLLIQNKDYPTCNKDNIDTKIEQTMIQVQDVVSCVHALRKDAKIKVRQPLSKIIIKTESNINNLLEFKDIILSETNIKDIVTSDSIENYAYKQQCGDVIVALDTDITEELRCEGIAREFIKLVQNYRKENKFNVSDVIKISFCSDDDKINNAVKIFNAMICKELLCDEFIFASNDEAHEFILNGKKMYIHITSL